MEELPAADSEAVCSGSEVNTVRPVRRRRLLRTAVVAAAIIVILVAIAATASAMGYNLFGWVPKWNSDVLSFGEEGNAPNELYDSSPIVVALTQMGIDEPLYPHWLPEGLTMDVSVVQTDPFLLHEGYSDGDLYFSITIVPSSRFETGTYQKDGIVPSEYCVNEHVHYVFSDLDQYSVTWNTDSYNVLMVGNVSLDEMKRIIDSVYEVMR